MNVGAVVPAAGAGRRFGRGLRKPFVLVRGQPLLIHALRALQASPVIRWIQPVVRSGDEARVHALLKRYRITKALRPCSGGSSRAESVAKGVACLPRRARWVLIHDGARPCLSQPVIARVVRGARRYGAAVCGMPASLTVKAANSAQRVRLTLDRGRLWFIQTPQAFRRDWWAQALARVQQPLEQFPDDASVLEAAGYPVHLVLGDPLNLKVTTREDLMLADVILKSMTRVAT